MTMVLGTGSINATLASTQVQELLALALAPLPIDGKRVLVIIPDGTRTAPIPLLFRLLYEQIGRRVARLDYLIALGTHAPTGRGRDREAGWGERGRARRALPKRHGIQPSLGSARGATNHRDDRARGGGAAHRRHAG